MSADKCMHHFPINIRHTEISALVAVRQSLVIDSHLMQDGCVQVVQMHTVADDVVPEVVRFTVDLAAFDSAAGHEVAA